MPVVELVPIYLSEWRPLLERLVPVLGATFGAEFRVRPAWFEPEASFDRSRGQYNSSVLLRQLLTLPGNPGSRVLGVTAVDLFVPVLTFVYGEAQLDGRAAVVSLHRLRPELYGLAPDEQLLFERLAKEAVHEFGHALGLIHCLDPACVMRSSTYVEEIDFKSAHFCAACLAAVRGREAAARAG